MTIRTSDKDNEDFIQSLHDICIPRCQHCLHPIASHQGDDGCTAISSTHSDGDDVLPCGCGQMLVGSTPTPLKGICSRCGDILHDGDATTCELCRGHKGEPWPERDEP